MEAYILHRACEGIGAFFERGVDVFLPGYLVAHLHSLVEEDFMGLLDLIFGVMGDHLCAVVLICRLTVFLVMADSSEQICALLS